MKQIKLLYILSLITLIQANINAQWNLIYTTSNTDLVAIDCINKDTVFAAGYNSTVLRTFDKGQTWETIDLGFEIYAKDINFPDEQTGYIVGASGRIAKTTDCGNNWELMIADTNYLLEKAEFIYPDTGWIIANDMIIGYNGGLILRTFNGGGIWDHYFIDDYDLFDIEMLNNLKGFIGLNNDGVFVDDYGFLKTEDGGNSWILSNPGMNFVTNISFINEEIGYSLGMFGPEGGSFKTTDGGETWVFTQGGVGGYTINNLQFLNEQTGFYAGWEVMFDDGKISRTDDCGNTWTDQITGNFWDIDMLNIDTGYAVIVDGKIYKTINGGIPVGITEQNITQSNCIVIFPNPLIEKSILKINPDILVKHSQLNFILYDQKGRKVKQIKNIKTSETKITRGNLPTGLYFYSLIGGNKIIESDKLLIK